MLFVHKKLSTFAVSKGNKADNKTFEPLPKTENTAVFFTENSLGKQHIGNSIRFSDKGKETNRNSNRLVSLR